MNYDCEDKNIVVETILKVVKNDAHNYLYGEIENCGKDTCKIYERGGVYGIAVKLSKEEKRQFFEIANQYNDKTVDEWLSLGDDFYPLYWGKDINLGFRLYEHTKNTATANTVQLNKRDYLVGKTVIYGAVFCKNRKINENKLRKLFPDILHTKIDKI